MNIVNRNDGDKEVVEFAAAFLLEGRVVVYPTETVYGLGCDATNKRAIKRIYSMKGREFEKGFLVLVDSLKMAKQLVVFNKAATQFAKEFWPGALTLILPTTPEGKKLFKSKTLGVRISSNTLATAIVKKIGRPLISTSANLTGRPAAQSGRQVMDIFESANDQPDLVLDSGKLGKSKGSTMVDCSSDKPVVLRQGDLKIKI